MKQRTNAKLTKSGRPYRKPGPKPGMPTLQQCKDRMAESGWIFQHQCIIGTYVFRNENTSGQKEYDFSLRELRRIYNEGW